MRLIVCLICSIALAGCTDRERASWAAFREPHIVELYSGGKVAATFRSTGKVQCSNGGICGWMDASTGKLVLTSGDIVVRIE